MSNFHIVLDCLVVNCCSKVKNVKTMPLELKVGNPKKLLPKTNGFFTYAQKCQYWHFCLYCVKTKKIQWQNVNPSGNRTQASHRSKYQVVHEQKLKDLLSSTCSVERRVLDLESEAMRGLGSIATGGNILSLEFFCCHVVKMKIPILTFLCICEKPDYAGY